MISLGLVLSGVSSGILCRVINVFCLYYVWYKKLVLYRFYFYLSFNRRFFRVYKLLNLLKENLSSILLCVCTCVCTFKSVTKLNYFLLLLYIFRHPRSILSQISWQHIVVYEYNLFFLPELIHWLDPKVKFFDLFLFVLLCLPLLLFIVLSCFIFGLFLLVILVYNEEAFYSCINCLEVDLTTPCLLSIINWYIFCFLYWRLRCL